MEHPTAQSLVSAGSEAVGVATSPQRRRAGFAGDSPIITVLDSS